MAYSSRGIWPSKGSLKCLLKVPSFSAPHMHNRAAPTQTIFAISNSLLTHTCLAKDFPSWDMPKLVERITSIRNIALTVVENKLCQVFTCHEYQPCLVIYNTKSGQWNTDSKAASLVTMLHFNSYYWLIKHIEKCNLELKLSTERERKRNLKCIEYLLKARPCAGTLLKLPL